MNTAPMLQGYTPMQQKKNIVKSKGRSRNRKGFGTFPC